MKKGLNQAKFLGVTLMEYESGYKAARMKFLIDGKEQWNQVWEPKDKFYRYGKEITDEEKVEEYRKEIFKMLARPYMIIHGEEKVKEAIRGIRQFKDYVLTLKGLGTDTDVIMDVFAQYQYRIQEGKKRTWLELPSDEAQGQWIAENDGEYKEQINRPYDNQTYEALTYVKDGKKHPFVRGGWFIDSNYWNPQGVTVKEKKKKEEPVTEPAGFDDDLPF